MRAPLSFPGEVKEPVGLLSRSSWCESMLGSHFYWSTSGIDEDTVSKTAAPLQASRVRFSGAPPVYWLRRQGVVKHRQDGQGSVLTFDFLTQLDAQPPPLRSSTAEHPPDKRKTVERHHAEGPFPFTLDGSDR